MRPSQGEEPTMSTPPMTAKPVADVLMLFVMVLVAFRRGRSQLLSARSGAPVTYVGMDIDWP
jgi:hypothetical protein